MTDNEDARTTIDFALRPETAEALTATGLTTSQALTQIIDAVIANGIAPHPLLQRRTVKRGTQVTRGKKKAFQEAIEKAGLSGADAIELMVERGALRPDR